MRFHFFFNLVLFYLLFAFFCCQARPVENFDLLELDQSPAGESEKLQATLIKAGKIPKIKGLVENSGFAPLSPSLFSYSSDYLVITHNDSFSNKKIFGLGIKGNEINLLFQTQLSCPAFNFDWEDNCALGLGRIAIADCGDNLKVRRFLSIYLVDFRPVASSYTMDSQILQPQPSLFKLDARFPGKPVEQKNFNVESLFQCNGKLYLFTKEKRAARLFALDLPTSAFNFAFGEAFPQETFRQEPNKEELLYCGSAKILSTATAADFNPHSMRIALLTYKRLYLYGLKSSVVLKPDSFLDLKNFQCLCEIEMDPKKQWESVCFLAENQILVGSEDSRYALYSLAPKP